MISLYTILKEVVQTVKCENCGWTWKYAEGGKDPYYCHKCKTHNTPIKEMAETDDDFGAIMYVYKNGSDEQKSIISSALALGPKSDEGRVRKALREAGKEDIGYIKEELGIADLYVNVNKPEELKQLNDRLGIKTLSEACWDGYRQVGLKKKGSRMVPNCVRIKEDKKKPKINPKYLTKDASAMKKEIDRVKKLKDDDPSAYGKWEADYADKAKTKKYKTKKSAATSAYEKRFGKKEKIKEETSIEKEMIDGIVEMLKQVKDKENRKKMALDRLKDFKKEDIKVDPKEFFERCGLKYADTKK